MNHRSLFILLSIGLFPYLLLGNPQYQRYQGADASRFITGATEVVVDEVTNRIEYIDFGPGLPFNAETPGDALLGALKMSPEYSLVPLGIEVEEAQVTHRRYSLSYKGVPLQDGMVVLHLQDNVILAANGGIHRKMNIANDRVLPAEAARSNALRHVGAQLYRWEVPGEDEHLRWETGDAQATYFPAGKLLLLPHAGDDASVHRYAWEFEIYSVQPLGRHQLFIDAETGELLQEIDHLCTIDVQGTAVTRFSGTQTITTDSTGALYRLVESGRGNGIETYNMQTGTSYSAAVDFTDADNFWNNVNAQQDEVATDAHWGAEMTYDYYYNVHNRNSIDGNGFALRSYVHYDLNYANAFWDGYRMTYGDGNASISPLVALDIVAHEISHGLTSYSAALVYSYESGAMNEAFSDIFGTAVEFYAKPTLANWTIGENIGSAFRSMSNPNAYGDPDTYLGNYWYSGTGDNGGVHTNSGVLNHWFYLLSEGGSGVNDNGDQYSVSGIGVLNAGKVAFRMLTVYLVSSSQYIDARFYAIKSAIDLFGACSPEVASVTNAMYAIGVGPAYYNGVLADFDASATSFCSVPAQVLFNNASVNGVSYTWDFGDGATSASADPLHYYTAAGNYTVRLIVDGGVCGADTIVKQSYISVTPPVKPTVIHGESCGPGTLVLTASASDTIRWYAPGNVLLHTGDTFVTPYLSQNEVYYVTNNQVGPAAYGGKYDNTGGGSYFTSSNSHHLKFDCASPVTLRSVKVYAGAPGNRTITLRNAGGTILESITAYVPAGESRVTLNFNVPAGTDFQLAGPGYPNLYRNSSGTAYPYAVGPYVMITRSSASTNPTGYYYYFYDWEVQEAPCVSEVVPAYAFINTDAPEAGFSYAQSGDAVVFQNVSLQGNSFVWDFGDGNSSTEKDPVHTYATSGVYDVTLHAFNACGDDSTTSQVTTIVTSLTEDITAAGWKLYPNPGQGWITLARLLSPADGIALKVYDALGQIMLDQHLEGGTDTYRFATHHWPVGLYIVELRYNGMVETNKLLIGK